MWEKVRNSSNFQITCIQTLKCDYGINIMKFSNNWCSHSNTPANTKVWVKYKQLLYKSQVVDKSNSAQTMRIKCHYSKLN